MATTASDSARQALAHVYLDQSGEEAPYPPKDESAFGYAEVTDFVRRRAAARESWLKLREDWPAFLVRVGGGYVSFDLAVFVDFGPGGEAEAYEVAEEWLQANRPEELDEETGCIGEGMIESIPFPCEEVS